MMVIFGALFVPIGLYLLFTPGIFRWIGIFNLLYLLASLLMVVEHAIAKPSQFRS